MKNAQSLAESLADNMCLASCYFAMSYMKKNDNTIPNSRQIISNVFSAYFAGKVDDECTCYDPEALLNYFGTPATVKKIYDKNEIAGLLTDGEPHICMYSYHTGNDATKIGHWVIVQNKQIIFNSLDYSKNVATGIITTIREIIWK